MTIKHAIRLGDVFTYNAKDASRHMHPELSQVWERYYELAVRLSDLSWPEDRNIPPIALQSCTSMRPEYQDSRSDIARSIEHAIMDHMDVHIYQPVPES